MCTIWWHATPQGLLTWHMKRRVLDYQCCLTKVNSIARYTIGIRFVLMAAHAYRYDESRQH